MAGTLPVATGSSLESSLDLAHPAQTVRPSEAVRGRFLKRLRHRQLEQMYAGNLTGKKLTAGNNVCGNNVSRKVSLLF